MRRAALAFSLMLALTTAAVAMVGGAVTVARDGRHIVMIVGSRANVCTATALTRDLLLTAGHCVAPAATYRALLTPPPQGGQPLPIERIVVHPRYSAKDYASGRVTADIALVKLLQPLPPEIVPVPLAQTRSVNPGDRFVVAGYGVTRALSDDGLGTPRVAALVATGRPGNLQIRLIDPANRNETPGLGACTGDSGGPAFIENGTALAVAGVVSWSTAAKGEAGCGGMTGVTPIWLHRAWLIEQAAKMGNTIGP
jgi:secreted trypsin-like serine protease